MLPEKKIDSLGARLEQFKERDQERRIDLDNLLAEYRQLLNEYKVLKKAYEDMITNTISKPFTLGTPTVNAAKKPLDSYVLVLVDGNDYIFNEELIRDKEEGGMRAARKLNDAIEKYIQSISQTVPRRVIVHIYADLTNLSKQLARLKLTGMEKRSLASFTAGFTRALSLFDFIDTLDEEGTRIKIRDQFKFASEDAACSHILFAACNDPAYQSLLVSYNGARDKVTLIQGSKWHPEFHQFNLEVTQFPTVFSWSGVSSAPPANKPATPTPPKQKAPLQQPILKPGLAALHKESWRRNDSVSVAESASGPLSPALTNGPQPSHGSSWRRNGPVSATESAFGDSSPEESNDFVEPEPEPARWDSPSPRDQAPQSMPTGAAKKKNVCRHFQKGFCRAGGKCNFLHGPGSLTGSVNGGDSGQDSRPLLSPTLHALSESSWAQGPAETSQASPAPQALLGDRSEVSSVLPKEFVPGFVPVNKNLQRLDPHYPQPSAQDWKVYNTHFHKAKPCNAFHLEGSCTSYDCKFDHSELDAQVRRVLEYVVKRTPCPRKSGCRREHCIFGHLCQKEDCKGPRPTGQRKCWFKPDQHYSLEDCQPVSVVPVENEEERSAVGEGNVGDYIGMEQVDLMW
ncbi:hypothetical protein COCMIDRAFT_99779 [Bipolaris oryzae ATCC 44560]|uniref:C3H1-type domain-containing protein n=1 Tax=Bipolaris oryzae ATCC 44560 TaxID=930090 RepID=W6Z1K9_COCMI|nr:uncharacterized protein COCMIDRAFT_99779 [Bipolaris oryzae ATCC 44560]EUC43835.1 hypothetical protein COCMIDRAFT_99779 [Bipolaris oryzae ATCC 44560]